MNFGDAPWGASLGKARLARVTMNQIDFEKIISYIDEKRRAQDEGTSGKGARVEEDSRLIEQILTARGEIATRMLIGVFADCLGVPRQGAKTRVSNALRKLLVENR